MTPIRAAVLTVSEFGPSRFEANVTLPSAPVPLLLSTVLPASVTASL